MPRFNSSSIRRAEYDPDTMRLQIWFVDGGVYTFCRVPAHIWQGLLAASSKGSYYNSRIRDRYHC